MSDATATAEIAQPPTGAHGMKVIDLDKERRKRDEDGPALKLTTYDENADVSMLVMPTATKQVAWVVFPGQNRGVLLSCDQAKDIALALLRATTIVEEGFLGALLDEEDEEEG